MSLFSRIVEQSASMAARKKACLARGGKMAGWRCTVPARRRLGEERDWDDSFTISVRGDDGGLRKLLTYIRDNAHIGHSFMVVVVDPDDRERRKSFTKAKVLARAHREMARTGLSAEELLLRAMEESATFKPEWPDTAEKDKAFVILWADGRGICAFRHKRDAQAFALKKSNDVVWVHYESPVRKVGQTGHRKNVRLRVANSYEPKQEDRLDGSNMHASGAGTLHQRTVLNRDGNPTISAETSAALGEFLPIGEEREADADGVACGVFLPVPYNLARLFPDKGEHDKSVPHYTLLFAGNLTVAEYAKLVQAVQAVGRAYEPFTLTMSGYHEFTNNDGQTIPHMGALQNLGRLHAALRVTAEVEDIPIAHTYGPEEDSRPYADQFKTHATLDYIDKGEPPYSGPKPTGSWTVTELEVWGHEKYRVPLGRTKADQPAEEAITELDYTVRELGLDEEQRR